MFGEVVRELRTFEAQPCRIVEEIGAGERFLVFKQHVVHFPEAALCSGGFGGLGGEFRERMGRGVRKMTEDDGQHVTRLARQRLEGQIGLCGVRTLEVRISDENHRSVRRASDVIARSNRDFQRAHPLVSIG